MYPSSTLRFHIFSPNRSFLCSTVPDIAQAAIPLYHTRPMGGGQAGAGRDSTG
jgi:hypothetical protein